MKNEHRVDSKPWLTMVHGFSQNSKIFLKQEEYFHERFQVFCPDLRGHGDHGNEDGPYGIHEYAGDILAQMDKRGIERTHFWGTHTGAATGLYCASYFGERIASLILEAPVIPGVEMSSVKRQLELTKEIAKTQGVAAALDNWFETAPWFSIIRRYPERCRMKEHKDIVFEFSGKPLMTGGLPATVADFSARLGTIAHPVLVYNGKEDVADFLEAATTLENHLPQVTRHMFPQLGGFPSWENPEVVNACVDDFLRTLHPA